MSKYPVTRDFIGFVDELYDLSARISDTSDVLQNKGVLGLEIDLLVMYAKYLDSVCDNMSTHLGKIQELEEMKNLPC